MSATKAIWDAARGAPVLGRNSSPGAARGMRTTAAWCALAAAALLLGGCGSKPIRGAVVRDAGNTTWEQPASAAPAPRTSRGGGYYQDDGPGDNPPANLDQLADAEPRVEPLKRAANNPYTVFGQRYVPLKTLTPYRKRGVGSWYGRKFHGQRTSSGETYDMYAMTAAHTTLPIPSYARVTNLSNRRSVIVRINDRGPFHSERIIDLSYAAAYKLGYIGSGSTQVEVESILPEEIPAIVAQQKSQPLAAKPEPQPAAESISMAPVVSAAAGGSDAAAPVRAIPLETGAGGIYVQLGAFSERDNAESFRVRIYQQLAWLNDAIRIFARDGVYRLDLGPYRGRDEAAAMAAKIRDALQFNPFVVVR